ESGAKRLPTFTPRRGPVSTRYSTGTQESFRLRGRGDWAGLGPDPAIAYRQIFRAQPPPHRIARREQHERGGGGETRRRERRDRGAERELHLLEGRVLGVPVERRAVGVVEGEPAGDEREVARAERRARVAPHRATTGCRFGTLRVAGNGSE